MLMSKHLVAAGVINLVYTQQLRAYFICHILIFGEQENQRYIEKLYLVKALLLEGMLQCMSNNYSVKRSKVKLFLACFQRTTTTTTTTECCN